ncbi:MAG: N-acetylmuramoyl-L-alanine amidase [Planctomycetes bacterium]|nr:N-acetylmuramoyl-L-alanine amidase [Planctomycetota bacterium]
MSLFATACAGVGPRPSDGLQRETDAVPPPPSFHSVTATPGARPMEEILALRSRRDHPGARLRIAFLLQETGNWAGAESELQQILFADPAPDRGVTALARWLRARGFERRGDRERARAEREAGLLVADEPELRERLTERAATPLERGSASPVPAVALAMMPRSTWKAAAARTRSMKPMGPVHRITIHHSATACRDARTTASIAAIRSIQRYHQDEQGWGDIGYHFLIDPAGRVWTGRAVDWQGAHAGDDERNQGNVGVCLLGNYTPGDQGPPQPAQIEALAALVQQLCARHGVAAKDVVTHRELKQTDCPGPYLQTAVEGLRARLARSGPLATGAGRGAAAPTGN